MFLEEYEGDWELKELLQVWESDEESQPNGSYGDTIYYEFIRRKKEVSRDRTKFGVFKVHVNIPGLIY